MKLWRGQPENFKPSPMSSREKGNLWLGFSGVFFLLALVSHFSPPSAPATGRWAWLHNAFFDLFGPSGDVILFSVAGSAGVIAALVYYRSKEQSQSAPGE